jgi:replicative DNA helicase
MTAPTDFSAMRQLTPPHDLKAEQTILGGALLDADLLDTAEGLRAEHFFDPRHRHVFSAMQRLIEQQTPLDLITLTNELQARGVLAHAGGEAYLCYLSTCLPASPGLAPHARIVQQKALLRTIAHVSLETYRGAMSCPEEPQVFADHAGQKLLNAVTEHTSSELRHIGPLLREVYTELEQLYENQNVLTGLPTGLDDLDEMTAGLQPGELVIVGARPSMGKTSFAMGIASHVALQKNLPVAVFSLEMTDKSITKRILAFEARVDVAKMRNGRFTTEDWPKLAQASSRLYRAPLHIHDGPVSVLGIRSKCRRLKALHKGLGLIVVDYLQLMDGAEGDNREQEIAKISRGLKLLAGELGAPVLALSQLNRGLEKRENKRPMMSDLRESGSLEQDADLICFLYRDEVYDKDSKDAGVAEIIVAKQRNGCIGTVRSTFLKEYTRFENLTSAASW